MIITPQAHPPVISRRAAVRLGALLTPVAIAAARQPVTAAQEATPTGTPSAASPSPELLSLIQYIRPEKVYFWVPGLADEAVRASLYQLDVAGYQALQAEFAAAARGAAEELLTEPGFAAKVDNLPFAPQSTVVVVGESDTDSLQSWFEILRHLLELGRPRMASAWRTWGFRPRRLPRLWVASCRPLDSNPTGSSAASAGTTLYAPVPNQP